MQGVFRNIILSLFLFLPQLIIAQKEAGTWYFGWNAGLDFKTGSPEIIHGGQIHTIEGVATINDSNGDLLFYTDGMTVWNKLHQPMPNGTGLKGHISSTQSAIIVPLIGDANRYYVFTIDDYGMPNGLQYSIVDMGLDGGNGDLQLRNVPIITGVSEKLTAVRHCNQRDIWIITHSTFGNTYYAFLVDPTGVNTAPVVTNAGPSYLGLSLGYLKASPDGRKLAAANWLMNASISDFDNATGVISNTYSLLPNTPDTSFRVYGVEFSPNGKLVYASAYFEIPGQQMGDMLLQFNVSLSTPAAVKSSMQLIAKQLWLYNFSALQIAIDGKIYMAKVDSRDMAAINYPNVYGPGCGYNPVAVQFTAPGEKSMSGLPNFIQSYFFKRDSFSYSVDCPGNMVRFSKTTSGVGETFVWNFGDPSSGVNNSSTMENPIHIYSSPGQHIVQLITYGPCGPDTVQQVVQTHNLKVNLGVDTLLCGNEILQLNANDGSGSYQYTWQDGTNNSTYTIRSPGTYWVEIKNPTGCTKRDSINIKYDQRPNFSLGPDQFICPGNTINIKPNPDPSWQLQWQDGSTAPGLTIDQPGLYSLRATNSCGTMLDEIIIKQGVCKVFVPTAFTPNNDGKNDLFKILGTEILRSMHLKIFNRWGEVVFETRDKSKGWNGTYKGMETTPGVYIYVLEYEEITIAGKQNLKGSFVLLR